MNEKITVHAIVQACLVCMGHASHLDDNIIHSAGELIFSLKPLQVSGLSILVRAASFCILVLRTYMCLYSNVIHSIRQL